MTQRITIRGIEYPTQAIAAAALAVTRQTVSQAAKHGQAALDRVGAGPYRPGAAKKQTTIGGHKFPSRKAAAAALGVSESALSVYIAVSEKIALYT